MKHFNSFLLGLSFVGLTAMQMSPAIAQDARLRKITYDADQVVPIYTQTGYAVHVVLGSKERIIDAGSGESSDCEDVESTWCIVAKKGDSDIYLKPQKGAHNTNLFVKTDKRNYSFDLIVLSEKARNTEKRMYRVAFVYPEERVAKSLETIASFKPDPVVVLNTKLAQPNMPVNWNYTMQVMPASSEIVPTMMYDDGRFTYLKFPNNREFPAIYNVADDGTESLLQFHVDHNDVMVVHRVAKRFVLRLGKAVVGLWNEAYDPDGLPPQDGVTVKGVRRLVKPQIQSSAASGLNTPAFNLLSSLSSSFPSGMDRSDAATQANSAAPGSSPASNLDKPLDSVSSMLLKLTTELKSKFSAFQRSAP